MVNKDWLDIGVLEDYLDGKLDAKTMNKVEREALEDPFVAEALAGLSAAPKRSLAFISLLQKQLRERIEEQHTTKKQSVITWQRLSIGSAAAVMFITVGIIYWMKQVNYDKLNTSKKVDVVIAPRVDKDTVLSRVAIPEALSFPKKEAIAQVKKAKIPAAAEVSVQDRVMVQSKVAAVPAQVEDRNARQTASSFTATAMAMPNSYGISVVRGKVVDERTGNPLVGASISVKDTQGKLRVVATVGPDGEFLFKKDDLITDSTITVSNILYATKVLPIHSKELLAIALKGQKNDLSDEVVVRGYVARKKDSTTGSSFIVSGKEVADVPVGKVEQLLQGKVAGLNIQNNTGAPGMRGSKNVRAMAQSHPVDGWDHYYMYIANNNKFKDKPRLGRSVELTFAVDTAGHAQSIKVFKGISSKYDKEAIRLIKEGPSWLQPEPVNSRISFKIDF